MIRELIDSSTSVRIHEKILGCNVTVLENAVPIPSCSLRVKGSSGGMRVQYCALDKKGMVKVGTCPGCG